MAYAGKRKQVKQVEILSMKAFLGWSYFGQSSVTLRSKLGHTYA